MQRPISEITSIIGGGTPSTKIEDYWDGDINWFTPSEIGNNIYAYSSIRKITKIGLKNSSAKILPKNKTILFTSRAGIGDTAILKNDAATNQGFQSLIVKENVDIYFLYSMAQFIKKEAIRRASGSTFLEISVTEMKKIKLYIPNVYEQKKIGKLIQILDRIITLEQEKVKKIEQLKESFLQNLFPKKDHYIPELRIQGFSKDWETIKLGSILSKGNRKKVDNPNNYNRLTVKLHKRGLEKFIPDRHMANTRPFYQRFSGELIIGKQNYFNGSLAIVSDEFDGYISSNAIMSFSILRADINFLYNYIGRDSYINERAYLANGTGQKELSEKDFLNFKIKAPSLLDQKEIGKLFKQ